MGLPGYCRLERMLLYAAEVGQVNHDFAGLLPELEFHQLIRTIS